MRWLRSLRPTRGELAAVLPAGILFGLSFPPLRLVLPVFLALAPLAFAVARRADSGQPIGTAARIGFWFGLIAYTANLYWIAYALSLYTKLALLGFAATILGMSGLAAGAAAALFAVRRTARLPMALLLPAVWVTFELALNYLSDLAFPWLPLGLATTGTPVLAQMAELSGVRGVSFWIAAINGLLADAVLLRDSRGAVARRAGAAFLLLVLGGAYGAWRMRDIELRPLAPVAVVQPNISQEEKWQEENRERIVGMVASLTREHLRESDPALVVWPEVALPGFLVEHPEWADTMRALTTVEGTPIVFGVLDVVFTSPEDYAYYNAAMLADASGTVGLQPPYRKTYLVPIVERVPFLNPRWFSNLKYFGGFGRGEQAVLFSLPFGRTGTLICYESIFPQRSRDFRRQGADMLLNITNDAWFGRTNAPYQHEAHMKLRAIETRVGVVRAANTGISEYIDPLGRAHGATDIFVPAAMTYNVETTGVRTLYVILGDWVGLLSASVTVSLLLRYRLRGRGGRGWPTRQPRLEGAA